MSFKLNMTDDEAKSKDYELPPTGNYTCRITDLTLDEVKKQGDNMGKPLWKMTLTVDEGAYAGYQIFQTIMLFQGALFALKNLCEAMHPEFVDGNDINLPSGPNGMPSVDPWIGEIVHIKATKFAAGTQRRGSSEVREYDEMKVKFRKPDARVKAGAASGGIPLPS